MKKILRQSIILLAAAGFFLGVTSCTKEDSSGDQPAQEEGAKGGDEAKGGN